jgi:hypothetical protein
VRKACGFKDINDLLTDLFRVFNVLEEVAVLVHAFGSEGVGGGSHSNDQVVVI